MHAALIGEMLGTMTLLIFGTGVVANSLLSGSKGQHSGWMAITMGWAIGALMGVFVAQSAGSLQADINPAVTIAKYVMGVAYVSWFEVFKIIGVQTVGAFLGATVVWALYYKQWQATDDANIKLAVYCTSPAIRHLPSNLLSEVLATTVLIVGIGAIVHVHEQANIPSGFLPYLICMLIWGIGLSLGGPTGNAINPARDFGARLAHFVLPIPQKRDSDWPYAWVPVVGPILGGLLGAVLWQVVF